MTQPKTPFSLNLKTELLFELRAISQATGVPMTRILEDALAQYLPPLRQQFIELARAQH